MNKSMNKPTESHLLSSMVIVPLKHIFTDEELLQKANEVASCVAQQALLEAEKKAIGSEYKNKIDKQKAEISLVSGHITNKYAIMDTACELFANFETKKREYRLKSTGELVKEEDLHASDYNLLQQKLDLDAQIEENNEVGSFANADPIGKVISDKKGKLKPVPKDNLAPFYNKDEEFEEDNSDLDYEEED